MELIILQIDFYLTSNGYYLFSGSASESRLIVQANDSPYGVVHWEKSAYITPEPDSSNSLIQLYIIRSQGVAGHIQVSYM